MSSSSNPQSDRRSPFAAIGLLLLAAAVVAVSGGCGKRDEGKRRREDVMRHTWRDEVGWKEKDEAPDTTKPVVDAAPAIPADPAAPETRELDDDWLLDVKGRWFYPTVVSYRPALGAAVDVNPPRFSWPYLPETLPEESRPILPQTTFDFQISPSADFAAPLVDIKDTPYNFHNSLAPLPPGVWYWRVSHIIDGAKVWSEPHSFVVKPNTPEWDRSVFLDAPKRLAARPRPRLGPPDGDWSAWAEKIASNPGTNAMVGRMESDYTALVARLGDLWINMPEVDAQLEGASVPERKGLTNRYVNIARACAIGAYLWRLTGDDRYAELKPRLLRMASYTEGGMSSPEAAGGHTKMTTQIIEFLATCYDVLHDKLTVAERQAILDAIEWRLRIVFFDEHGEGRNTSAWYQGENAATMGVTICAHSHPYQNFMWAGAALPLVAGDIAIADELIPLVLNYHAGVTASHGMDEGWTEGVHYATEKSETMMRTARIFDLFMPELRLGSGNPIIANLAVWMAQIMPIGLQRQPFGDLHGLDLDQASRNLTSWFWLNSITTGSPTARDVHGKYVAEFGERFPLGLYSRPWVDIPSLLGENDPESAWSIPANHLFLDSGWVSVNSVPLKDRAAFNDSVGMIFQARPSGGFSHSYGSDGSYVWYAHGQTMSGGGGSLFYPDPFCHDTAAHNAILIDGKGQSRIDERKPYAPYIARIIAYHEEPGLVSWVADLTNAYPSGFDARGFGEYELEYYHRHVLFIDQQWFVTYDDIKMKDRPARFSWVYHAHHPTPLEFIEVDGRLGFAYAVEGVNAEVLLATPAAELEWLNLEGREGYKNPITGEDAYYRARTQLRNQRRMDLDNMFIPQNNIWITNRVPSQEYGLLAAIVPYRDGGERVRVAPISPSRIVATYPDGARKTIAFESGGGPADIKIDLEAVRNHAKATRSTGETTLHK